MKSQEDGTKKRIDYKEEFESCYLRHKYIQRIKINPTMEEMLPYNKIVEKFATNTFYIYKNLFILIGMNLEDLINISKIHLVSYLGLFALERNPNKLRAFKKTFKKRNNCICSKEDLLNKNKANFTCFLKQRLEDVIRVCRQKAKNIKGYSAEEFVIFKGTRRPPNDIEDLLEDPKKYGYRSMSTTSFKSIKKQFEKYQIGPVYTKDNLWYVCVPINKKHLTLNDFVYYNIDPYSNRHNMTPEEIFESKNERQIQKFNYSELNKFSNTEQRRIIKMFITENKTNPKFREEILIAKKLLKSDEKIDLFNNYLKENFK